MARYDRGYDRSLRPATGNWARPGGGSRRGFRYDRFTAGERPWVDGPFDGYQGGSYGIPVGGGYRGGGSAGYRGGYDPGYRARYDRDLPRGSERGAGRPGEDLWWLGERAFDQERSRDSYDEAYRRFNEATRPRFSPVGGNYPAMGGEYGYRRPPEPLREERWFSDWTRWF
jgi:hypothetical protein